MVQRITDPAATDHDHHLSIKRPYFVGEENDADMITFPCSWLRRPIKERAETSRFPTTLFFAFLLILC